MTVLVLAQDANRLDAAMATLRSEPDHRLKSVVLPDLETALAGAGRPRLARLLPGAAPRLTVHDNLVASCRDLQVAAVVAADHESAKVARRLVDDLPQLLAVMGADAALRVLAQQRETGRMPGGSPDDVFGRTRFLPDADALPASSHTATGRLVIGPDNRDGRAGSWALLASTAETPAYACQVVDGTDFFGAPADLSISRGEWRDETVGRRFTDAVTSGTTHVLQTGAADVLPAGFTWPDHVRRALVFDVIDLVPADQIDEIAARVPEADGRAVSEWKARAVAAAPLIEQRDGPVFATGWLRGMPVRMQVLPLAVPQIRRLGSRRGETASRPLVVTARPDLDLGHDPVAEVVARIAAEGSIQHVPLTGLPPSLWGTAIKAADAVVDRVWLPGMGMAAAIAMALDVPAITGSASVADDAPVMRTSVDELPDALDAVLGGRGRAEPGAGTAFADRQRELARSAIADFVRA